MLSLKKQLFMLAFVASIAAPACAMDSNQESSGWFGWKTEVGLTALAIAGIGYCVYTNWATGKKSAMLTRPIAKPAQYFATHDPATERTTEQEAECSLELTPEIVDEMAQIAAEQEVYIQEKLARRDAFSKLPLIMQKLEIANEAASYVHVPSQGTEDIIREYTDIYCAQIKSNELAIAINKLFAAPNRKTKQEEQTKIKQLLGLVNP